MTKVFIGTKQEYSLDGYLVDNLNEVKKIVKQDMDFVIIVDGSEGSGKSVFAMQNAFYLDPTFNLDRIAFTPKQFKEKVLKAEKYQAIVYDEAYTGLSSRAATSLINKTLVSMLAEIRQKNLFVFVVMPSFFDLDKYVALWRSRILLHVYMDDLHRGYFSFFNEQRKLQLYTLGKKFYNYYKPEPNFRGRFTNYYVVNEKKYRAMKHNALCNRDETYIPEFKLTTLQRNALIRYIYNYKMMNQREIAEYITRETGVEFSGSGVGVLLKRHNTQHAT